MANAPTVQKPKPPRVVAAELSSGIAAAVQALAQGAANDGQQKIALKWILEEACGLPNWPYRDSPRDTDVELGRHFVAHQIMRAMKMNISKLRQREERGDANAK